MANHYEILGVERSATAGEVRKAYMRLARERHPDLFTDSAEKAKAQQFFQELTEAFNTLSNDRRRREYDAELARPKLETPEAIANDAYSRALKKVEERDTEAAVELLKVAVHHSPEEPRYHAALGRAQARHPHWIRDALQSLEKAVQLSPQSAGLHLELASLLAAQGLKLRARKLVESALKLAPGEPAALRLAAELGIPDTGSAAKPDPAGPISGLKGLFGRKG